ncbi:hypothetical protein OHA21_12275 [Actinoplanes sp. NBC_00393]|uniref:hypothetical protein n=1 Tax=Actinoplanes sp. NBC_00393 TaxID=2975953 RepID=UPI002E21B87E
MEQLNGLLSPANRKRAHGEVGAYRAGEPYPVIGRTGGAGLAATWRQARISSAPAVRHWRPPSSALRPITVARCVIAALSLRRADRSTVSASCNRAGASVAPRQPERNFAHA